MASKLAQSRAARPMPPYTTSSPGRSATAGSRLFMSMRSGASVSQLLAESFVPVGARITRLSSTLGSERFIVSLLARTRREREAGREHVAQHRAHAGSVRTIEGDGPVVGRE